MGRGCSSTVAKDHRWSLFLPEDAHDVDRVSIQWTSVVSTPWAVLSEKPVFEA